jgi:hypothetical protein
MFEIAVMMMTLVGSSGDGVAHIPHGVLFLVVLSRFPE